MKRVALGCGVLLAIFVVLVAVVVGVGKYRSGIRGGTWLEVSLQGDYLEYRPDNIAAALLLQEEPVLRDVTDALDKAAADPRIEGLVAKIGTLSGWAKTEEIRSHIAAFRASGKPTICYMETAGEFGQGNLEYYLASAFEKIYLGPSGDVGLVGLMTSSLFIRGTLDKLEIYPDMDHIGDYKSAKNMFTEKEYTPAHREMMLALIESIEKNLVAGISEGRGLGEEQVRALMAGGPYLGEEALDAGLVDGLKYRDEVYAELTEAGEKKPRTVRPRAYLKSGRPGSSGSSTIAVVYGVGVVQRGKSEMDPFSGDFVLGSDTVAKDMRTAGEDSSVKAIVFRVDSPGGSYVASDIIWREVVRAKENKPVVVSMSDVAGSGGYFVAMHASEIVAQPSTITASIGVLGGKMDMKGFYNMIGLTKDHLSLQPNADMFYDYQRFTPDQRKVHYRMLSRIYDDFSHKVADGRSMPWEEVDRIGRGRVWTGADAKSLGLVDHLGGMDLAIARAKDLAGIAEDEEVRLRIYPQEKTLWQAITARGEETSTRVSLRSLQRAGRLAVAFLRSLAATEPQGALTMPETPEIR